jgi:hypothetical protein
MSRPAPFRPRFTFVDDILRRGRAFRLGDLSRLFSLFRSDESAPEDPCAGVREPHRRTPGGRSAAEAVAEPEPPTSTRAVSR